MRVWEVGEVRVREGVHSCAGSLVGSTGDHASHLRVSIATSLTDPWLVTANLTLWQRPCHVSGMHEQITAERRESGINALSASYLTLNRISFSTVHTYHGYYLD